MTACAETEGAVVCFGDLYYEEEAAPQFTYQFAAKVKWGMGSMPMPQADSLVVGGDFVLGSSRSGDVATTGGARIGGRVVRSGAADLKCFTEKNVAAWEAAGTSNPGMPARIWLYDWVPDKGEPYADAATRRHQDLQNRNTVQQNLGYAAAFKATSGRKLEEIDYA